MTMTAPKTANNEALVKRYGRASIPAAASRSEPRERLWRGDPKGKRGRAPV